jgi:hypothetical protein
MSFPESNNLPEDHTNNEQAAQKDQISQTNSNT